MKCKICHGHMESKDHPNGFSYINRLCRTCLYICMLDLNAVRKFYGEVSRTYYYCKYKGCPAKHIFKNPRLQCWKKYGMCGRHALITHPDDYVGQWMRSK